MVKTEEILRFEENPEKNPETRLKSGKNIITSHLRSKPSNLSRNMIKTIKIWRFEKCPQEKLRNKKKTKKKRFLDEVKISPIPHPHVDSKVQN